MKNFKPNKWSLVAKKPVSKACAWILSIMLVVTGISPSFARNAGANGAGAEKVVYKRTDVAKKGSKAEKPHALNASKTKKSLKASEGEKGKKNKIRNKRTERYILNESGNVYGNLDGRELTLKVTDLSGDTQIERVRWGDMVEALGGNYIAGNESSMSWEGSNCTKIKCDANDIQLPRNSSRFFCRFDGQVEGFQNLKTDSVTDMDGMFYGAGVANPDVSSWNTANVVNMMNMFFGAKSATPNVSNWDVSNVEFMYYMFCQAVSADPDVSNWNVSNVIDMHGMFDSATIANPDVSNWKVSKVKDMHGMFRAARAADPDVSRWDVSNVTNMNEIFRSSNAATADVSNWNVSEVTNMKGMFKNCAAKMLDLSKWKLNQELLNSSDKMKNMFESYANIEYLKTPEGLKTDISGANGEFSVVKLKKGVPAAVEQDKQELNSVYQINEGNDKNAVYHIYRNDKYASVFFNKYNGDNEAWANHEIVEQGKSIKESKGSLPAENPELAGNQFVGWSKDKNATTSDFDENTKVDKDTIVYAAWREKQNVNVTFVANGGSGNMEAVQTYKDESYTLPACTFTPPAGKEFDK